MRASDNEPEINLNEIHLDIAQGRAASMLDASYERYCGMDNQVARSVLAGFHSLITYFEYESGHPYTRSKKVIGCLEDVGSALQDIAESLDFLAASEADEIAAESVLSDHEKQVIYRALESDYINSGTALSIEEMDAVLARFKRIAGM